MTIDHPWISNIATPGEVLDLFETTRFSVTKNAKAKANSMSDAHFDTGDHVVDIQ